MDNIDSTTTFTLSDYVRDLDLIDSRDLIAKADDLRVDPDADAADRAFVEAVDSLADDVSEWTDGATLIAEAYFVAYARELAEDVIPGFGATTSSWPFDCIDWQKAADKLRQDYDEVEVGIRTYLVRS